MQSLFSTRFPVSTNPLNCAFKRFVWKNIPGFEGYQISENGQIKSFKQSKKGKILTPQQKGNYLYYNLTVNSKGRHYSAHRLVKKTFNPIENDSKFFVHHKNCNGSDNRLQNLEWVTPSQNNLYRKKFTDISDKQWKFNMTDLSGEVWKCVVGYEGLYQISNYGRVKSLRGNHKIMKLRTNKGYLRISLTRECRNVTSHSVHRLVASAFISNIENKKYIDHIDGNESNNYVTNLRWATASENIIWGFKRRNEYKILNKSYVNH